LLATLALAWLAWRVYGPETARWLLLLLPTTVGMIGFSHAAATDMPFSAMLTVAMVCAAVILGLVPKRSRDESPNAAPQASDRDSAHQGRIAAVLFGIFLGLAVLAKGPAAIILCGGAVFFWALFTRRWREALRLLQPTAIITFCATALPWYILCSRRNPDFFRIFIIEHNFKRFLTPEFQHIQPFWFYIPILLAAFLPWSALLAWAVCIGAVRVSRLKKVSPLTLYFLAWSLFCIAFFSISQSKLPGYVLPAVPAIGILLAYSHVAAAPQSAKSFRFALLTGALLFFAIFALGQWTGPHLHQSNNEFGIAVGLVALAMGIANVVLTVPRGSSASLLQFAAPCCVIPILLSLSLTDKVLPAVFQFDPSGRSLARELQSRNIPSGKLAVYAMNRGLHYSLNFYLGQEIKEWDRNRPTDGYVLTGRKNCASLSQPSPICEEIPFDPGGTTGRFLYKVTLPAHAPGSGQPQ